jgi:murein DD-endopeptidase MepM/ murein hydrolase activator NlpD
MAPNASADNLNNRHHKAEKGIKHAQADLDDSSHAQVVAAARLSAAKTRLAAAQHLLAGTQRQLNAAQLVDTQMQAKLQQAESDLADAQQQVAEGKANVTEQRAQIGRLAAENYQYGDPQLMSLVVVLNSQEPGDVTNQMNTVDNLMNRETATMDRLKALTVLLGVQEAKVARTTATVATQRKAAAATLVKRQLLEHAAATQRSSVATLVASRRSAAQAAARNRAHDKLVLARAKKQEARIKRLIMARASKQKGGYTGNTSGLLYRPVPGWVTSPYGWRIHPIYHYWGLHDGTDFHAPCGTPEHAAESGTVISEYYSDVWGNRLYLDLGKVNGQNMTVIYNHLERYKAHPGDHVSRGEVVGYAGTTGWSTGCHLHFTVMLNGNPVDPMKFM